MSITFQFVDVEGGVIVNQLNTCEYVHLELNNRAIIFSHMYLFVFSTLFLALVKKDGYENVRYLKIHRDKN